MKRGIPYGIPHFHFGYMSHEKGTMFTHCSGLWAAKKSFEKVTPVTASVEESIIRQLHLLGNRSEALAVGLWWAENHGLGSKSKKTSDQQTNCVDLKYLNNLKHRILIIFSWAPNFDPLTHPHMSHWEWWTVEDWTDFTIHKRGLNDKCEVTGTLSIYHKRGGSSAAIWTNILVHQTNKLKYIFNQKTLIIIDSRRHISNILFEIVNKKLGLFNYLDPSFYIFGWVQKNVG